MIAYHGDPTIKQKYLKRVADHRLADELIHGIGWENSKGCAVGCTLEAYDHARYETELGIPQMLAHLEDRIFEGLPNGEAQLWPERFLTAIHPGADLSLIGWKFLAWLIPLTLERYGTKEVVEACQPVITILIDLSNGQKVAARAAEAAAWEAAGAAEAAASVAAWEAASAAARAAEAAAWGAEAAARAAARAAAWGAEAAAWGAEAAARAAARAAAWGAEAAAYKEMADKLEQLLHASY